MRTRIGTALTVLAGAAAAAFLAGILTTADNQVAFAEKNYTYPEAMKQDVVDDYHGTRLADPYR